MDLSARPGREAHEQTNISGIRPNFNTNIISLNLVSEIISIPLFIISTRQNVTTNVLICTNECHKLTKIHLNNSLYTSWEFDPNYALFKVSSYLNWVSEGLSSKPEKFHNLPFHLSGAIYGVVRYFQKK